MLRSFLLSLSLLPAVLVSARSPLTRPAANRQINSHRQFVSQLLSPANATAQKTTFLTERVIAVADTGYFDGESTADSTTFAYTGSHGSAYDYNNLEYNLDYPYNYYPMFNFVRHITKPMVICDTVKAWFQGNNGVYGYQENQVYNYDAHSNILGLKDVYIDSANFTNYHYVNAFNGNNDVIYSLQLQANGMGGYDSSQERFYSYDGQGHITQDSTYNYNGGWQLSERYTYSYNNGNLAEADEYVTNGNTWVLGERYQATYTMNNQLQRLEQDYNNNGNLEVEIVDTFGYTNGVNYHTFWKESSNDGNGNLDSILVERYHVNQQLVPDTIYVGNADDVMNSSWINYFVSVTYNSFNDPTSAHYYKYNNNLTSDTLQDITNYYYEAYTNGVANTVKRNITVYPNPTANIINVQLDNSAASLMSLRLINTAGQTVAGTAVTGNSAQLSMDNLSAGVYWLMILDDKGMMIHRQAVVKQ